MANQTKQPDTQPDTQLDCFVPDPKFTFCFAPRDNLCCTICLDSKLTLPRNRERIRDTNPSILPCGHVFGKQCLDQWLKTHDTCPNCRRNLRYQLCMHPIRPRRLTRENVTFLPRTVPDGGVIGYQCGKCKIATDQRVAAELWMSLSQPYYRFKLAYEESESQSDKFNMEQKKDRLDEVMRILEYRPDQQW